MDKSAIILAGGFSEKFGSCREMTVLAGKPLIKHLLDVVGSIVEESVVVVSSRFQAEKLVKLLDSNGKVVVDKCEIHCPLVGAFTGFSEVQSEYAILLPCDTPLVSKNVLSLILELCIGVNAAIPRWPNSLIEPLHAAYKVKPALEEAEKALKRGILAMHSMIAKLQRIRYISTLVLQQLDPELKIFSMLTLP
ncbi:MAG: NTP transferase domain-containing protein [Candidatus Bathyarchaeia archaeon]